MFLHFWLGEIGAFPKMNHDLWGLVVMFQHIILCWLSHIKIKVLHHLMQISKILIPTLDLSKWWRTCVMSRFRTLWSSTHNAVFVLHRFSMRICVAYTSKYESCSQKMVWIVLRVGSKLGNSPNLCMVYEYVRIKNWPISGPQIVCFPLGIWRRPRVRSKAASPGFFLGHLGLG